MAKSNGGVAPAPKTDRNRQIVEDLRSGKNGAEIARAHGVSRQRVHQLRRRADRMEATERPAEAVTGPGDASGA